MGILKGRRVSKPVLQEKQVYLASLWYSMYVQILPESNRL